jgi:hypothetical protein
MEDKKITLKQVIIISGVCSHLCIMGMPEGLLLIIIIKHVMGG